MEAEWRRLLGSAIRGEFARGVTARAVRVERRLLRDLRFDEHRIRMHVIAGREEDEAIELIVRASRLEWVAAQIPAGDGRRGRERFASLAGELAGRGHHRQ